MEKYISSDDLSSGHFDVRDTDTKYIKARLIRMLVIAVNKNKLDYGTLRYIYRQVIQRTKLSVPRKAKKLYVLPTSEELDRFFETMDDPQVKLLFQVIHNCGLRVSEVCSIRAHKIDFQNRTIFITGKGNKDRLIPITSRLADNIKLFLSGRNHHFLFETKLGTPYSTRRVEQLCQLHKEKARIIKKFSPHTLRHYFFSRLAEQGLDVDIRAMIAGHSNAKTQEIYTHVGLAGTKDLIIDMLEKMEAAKILK